MATVVNNPQPTQSSDNGMGYVFGIILLIVLAFLFFYYGLPLLRGANSGYSAAPQVNVPGHVDVNVNHTGTGK